MRYIVDVTQLVHWPGNLTGIPRVMDELATRFQKYNSSETIFVSWVHELNAMCELNFASTHKHRGNGIDYILKTTPPLPSTPATHNTSTKTISTKPLIKKTIKTVAAKSRFDRTQIYKKALGAARTLEIQRYKTYEPQVGDKLFIPWGEWWDSDWLNLMVDFAGIGVDIFPVCHDILPMVVPQFSGNSSSLADFVTQVFPVSTAVVTPSNSTKRDLTKWMQDRQLKVPAIEVFGLGEDFSIGNAVVSDDTMTKKYNIEKDNYLMYVSTIEARKNHTLLYYAYKLAHSKGIELPKLLIIGRVGHDTSEIIKFIKEDPEVNDRLVICDFVIDDELNWLYKNCMFTIMPSFYEGWGISVIEAVARGKSAVCSNTSSLLEISDDYVLRFNPASTDECLQAITTMMQPATLKKYRNNTRNYRPHSWDRSFKQVLTIMGDN